MSELLDDLIAEKHKAEGYTPCSLCEYILSLGSGLTADTLKDAAAGTLSERALIRILAKHKTGVGRRTIARHRAEGHKP